MKTRSLSTSVLLVLLTALLGGAGPVSPAFAQSPADLT
jgi:hypothetical protein